MFFKVKLLTIVLLPCLSADEIRPNFVIILTDDQDVILGGLTPMLKVRTYIAQQGVIFDNAYTTSPICCPSRSSILTGLYVHNHGTTNNSLNGGCSSLRWQKKFEKKTFAATLHNNGYRTFYAGKYLNQYGHKKCGGVEHVPEGWDWWIGLVGNSVYYNYTLSINGSGFYRGGSENDYLTDVLREYGMEFLKSRTEPFFMMISTPSPHEPFTPAARHEGIYSRIRAPRTPNFNKPVDDSKHWLMRLPPNNLPLNVINEIDLIFRNRWETLLAVDEMIESIISALEESKSIKNTYFIITSDNGFHLGQFGQPWDKRQPYETDIKIPLIMMGPQILKNKIIFKPVLNVDLAPTILDMAGIEPKYPMDGQSFLSAINIIPGEIPPKELLIEYYGEGNDEKSENCYHDPNVKLCQERAACKCFDSRNNTYYCLRYFREDSNISYCEFQDNERYKELYDLRRDPYQLNNLATTTTNEILKNYSKLLRSYKRKTHTVSK